MIGRGFTPDRRDLRDSGTGIEPPDQVLARAARYSQWDGSQAIPDLAARYPTELLRFREDPYYSRPGGEAHADLETRVVAAFDRATALGGTVLVASHRKPIMTVLGHVLGISHQRIWRLATAPASLTSIEVWADGGMSVAFVNDTAHLR